MKMSKSSGGNLNEMSFEELLQFRVGLFTTIPPIYV